MNYVYTNNLVYTKTNGLYIVKQVDAILCLGVRMNYKLE